MFRYNIYIYKYTVYEILYLFIVNKTLLFRVSGADDNDDDDDDSDDMRFDVFSTYRDRIYTIMYYNIMYLVRFIYAHTYITYCRDGPPKTNIICFVYISSCHTFIGVEGE